MRLQRVVDLARVQRVMAEARLDLLLVNAPANVWYLSGYPLALSGLQGRGYGRNAVVLVPRDHDPILVPGAFEEQISRARAWVSDIETFSDYVTPPVMGAAEVIWRRKLPHGRVGVERDHLSYRFGQLLREALPDAELIPADRLLDAIRAAKTPREISGIEATLRKVAPAALEAVLTARAGQQEHEVHTKLVVSLVRALWTEKVDGSVLSGPRVGLWGAQSGERRLAPGDWVRVEYTIAPAGYPARLCRMGTIGEPTSAQQDLYQRYVDACTKAIQGLKLGMRGADASDGFNREFRGRGLSLLGWATGFGLGYGPVEPPYLSSAEELELHPGMVVSLEPMIKEGIRANWEIVVEESGARILDSPFAAERLFVARQV